MISIKTIAKWFVVVILVFILQKLYFMALTWREGTVAADVIDVVWHGIRLDLAVTAYSLILPLLAVLVQQFVKRPLLPLLKVYYCIIAVVFAIIIVADASLYPFWQFKLDASVFLYTDKPADALASVSIGYITGRLLWIVIWMYFQYRIAMLLRVFRVSDDNADVSIGTAANGTTPMRWLSIAVLVVIGGLMALAIRGGVGKGTNNVSVAYYSDNQYLNHAAVNPVFNLLYSLGKQEDFGSEAQFFATDEAERIATGIYGNNAAAQSCAVLNGAVSNSADKNSTDKNSTDTTTPPFLRTSRPDILLIIWEGGCWNLLREKHAGPAITALADESIDFTNCYANSFRTDRGQLSLLSGWPAIPKTSLMKIPEKCDRLSALPRTLLDNGYTTTYWYGGDITFANTGGYMHQSGFQRCVSDKDFSSSERATAWGVYDGTLLDRMAGTMIADYKQRKDGKPSFNCVMTLTSHEPWTVPDGYAANSGNNAGGSTSTKASFADPRLTAFNYTDGCLQQLLDRLRQSPMWQNLLVIVTADHGVVEHDNMAVNDPKVTRIPMLWTGDAITAPQKVPVIMNQSDLAATLLSQLGISHDAFIFSRDVLSPGYKYPSAFHAYNGGISFVDSTGYTTYDLDGNTAILNPDTQRERKAKGILQYLYRKIKEL